MITFFTDLDNTLIYSYKHDIGSRKKCVEIYQGREISFMTEQTWELLREISGQILVAPVTTRTVEQYSRIQLGLGQLPYALTCNGGVLLVNGLEDRKWYLESLEMTAACLPELEKAEAVLEKDENRSMEVRNIKNLFVFTKSIQPEESAKRLCGCLDTSRVDVFRNGVKVYVLPKELSKGNGVRRLKEMLGPEMTIAAGDSAFDLTMLEFADIAIAPAGLLNGRDIYGRAAAIADDVLFSEGMLAYVSRYCKSINHITKNL